MAETGNIQRYEGRTTAHVLSVCLVALALAAPSVAAADVHRFALVLGNNDGDATSEPLRHAERDAEKMYSVLGELGDIPAENLELLVGATADDVRSALQRFETRFVDVRRAPEDRILFIVYYSGHGNSSYLELAGTELPLTELREMLRRSRATLRLAILDSCFSGAMLRAKGGRRAPAFPLAVDDRLSSEGYAFMTSSSASERAQESDEVRGSFFTHFLTSGLRGGADFSGDGMVTLSEAYRYTYHQTLKRSALSGAGPQHPHFDYEISGEDELVLTRLERANATLQFPAGLAGSFLLYAPGTETVLAEVTLAGAEARTLAVPAGDYSLYERGGPVILEQPFAVAAGEVHVVDLASMSPVTREDYRLKGPLIALQQERRFSLAPKIGVQGMFDGRARSQVVAPALLYGVEASFDDIGIDGVTLVVDFLASYARQDMQFGEQAGQQDFLQLNLGLSALYTFWFGDFGLALGPRAAAIYMRRDVLDDDPDKGVDDIFRGTLQADLRLQYRPLDWLSVSLEGRFGWLRLALDDSLDVSYGEAFLNLSFYP